MTDTHTVDISIPVEANVAAALDDAGVRAMAGRLVSRMLQPASIETLFKTMDAISAEVTRRGLTDDVLDVELAAYNAEDQEPSAPPSLDVALAALSGQPALVVASREPRLCKKAVLF